MDLETTSAKHKLEELGLKFWDEHGGLMLLPKDLLPFIPEEMNMTSINGHRMPKNMIDTDTRVGILAYGFTEKQYKEVASLLMKVKK
jgi:hypothetical protein